MGENRGSASRRFSAGRRACFSAATRRAARVLASARRRRQLGREPRRRAPPRAARGDRHRGRDPGRGAGSDRRLDRARSQPRGQARRPHRLRRRPDGPVARDRHLAGCRRARAPAVRGGRARRDRAAPADPALPATLDAGRSGGLPRRSLGSLEARRREIGPGRRTRHVLRPPARRQEVRAVAPRLCGGPAPA